MIDSIKPRPRYQSHFGIFKSGCFFLYDRYIYDFLNNSRNRVMGIVILSPLINAKAKIYTDEARSSSLNLLIKIERSNNNGSPIRIE